MGLEDPELLVADDPAIGLLGLDERGCGPSQGHRSVFPVGHPAGLLSHPRVGAIDQVGRGEALPQSARQTEPVDREYLGEAFA